MGNIYIFVVGACTALQVKVGKVASLFVVRLSTTKTTNILPPTKITLYIYDKTHPEVQPLAIPYTGQCWSVPNQVFNVISTLRPDIYDVLGVVWLESRMTHCPQDKSRRGESKQIEMRTRKQHRRLSRPWSWHKREVLLAG